MDSPPIMPRQRFLPARSIEPVAVLAHSDQLADELGATLSGTAFRRVRCADLNEVMGEAPPGNPCLIESGADESRARSTLTTLAFRRPDIGVIIVMVGELPRSSHAWSSDVSLLRWPHGREELSGISRWRSGQGCWRSCDRSGLRPPPPDSARRSYGCGPVAGPPVDSVVTAWDLISGDSRWLDGGSGCGNASEPRHEVGVSGVGLRIQCDTGSLRVVSPGVRAPYTPASVRRSAWLGGLV